MNVLFVCNVSKSIVCGTMRMGIDIKNFNNKKISQTNASFFPERVKLKFL